jgi:two-component sensor histidine kinase
MWNEVFSNPDNAIKIGKELIDKENNQQQLIAKTIAQVGVAYDIKGLPDSALNYFLKAIKIQEELKDSVGLSFTYNNMGLMYYAQYDYPSALKFLKKSLSIDRLINDNESAAGSLINIGIIYTYLDSLDKSTLLYEEAYGLYKKMGNQSGMLTALSNMGKVYFARGMYEKALDNYLEVEEYYKTTKVNAENLSSNYNSLANTYLKLKNYNEALVYAKKDLAICSQGSLVNKKQFAYETLNEIYKTQGNFEKAHEYLKKYTDLRDSILTENRTEVIEEMQTKYETEKTEKELVEVRLEKEKEKLKHQNEKQVFYGLTGLFVLLLVFLFFGYRSKKKINNLLSEKNHLNEEIIQQKELLLGEVHHRVKNNLQLINSIVELQAMDTKDEKSSSSLADIQKRIAAIAELHQFLYQSDDVEKVDVNQYLTSLVEGLKQSFNKTNKQLEIIPQIASLNLDIKTAVPIGLIVNELVTNALKYAFVGKDSGSIQINLNKDQNRLILSIKDDGVGIDNENPKSSFGMKMVKSLCRQLKAKWEVKSENGVEHILYIERFKDYE